MRIFIPGTENIDVNSIEVKDLSLLPFIKGKSAYEIAVSNGFSGTETDWLNSLKVEFQATANEFLKQAVSDELTRKDNEVSRVEAENLRKQEFDRFLETFAVVDNLDSESVSNALSANQGRILNEEIQDLKKKEIEEIDINYNYLKGFNLETSQDVVNLFFSDTTHTGEDYYNTFLKVFEGKARLVCKNNGANLNLFFKTGGLSSGGFRMNTSICWIEDNNFKYMKALSISKSGPLITEQEVSTVNISSLFKNQDLLNDKINNLDVFYWDGKSSDENPNNIALWQEITDKVYNSENKKPVLVYSKPISSELYNGPLFVIGENSIEYAKMKRKIRSYSTFFGKDIKTLGVSLTEMYYEFSLTLNNTNTTESFEIQSVSAISRVSKPLTSARVSFLSTINAEDGELDEVNFTPVHDMHPATKKYVDEKLALLGSRISILEGNL